MKHKIHTTCREFLAVRLYNSPSSSFMPWHAGDSYPRCEGEDCATNNLAEFANYITHFAYIGRAHTCELKCTRHPVLSHGDPEWRKHQWRIGQAGASQTAAGRNLRQGSSRDPLLTTSVRARFQWVKLVHEYCIWEFGLEQ